MSSAFRLSLLTAALLLAGDHRAAAETATAPVAVTFRVNDAFVKDRMLPGVAITVAAEPNGPPVAQGTADAGGVLELELAPGTWFVSYQLAGYVPLPASEAVIERAGQVVTTTLSMMLEAEGLPPDQRRLRLVLNWGSDPAREVRDADSHLVCACGTAEPYVSYLAMEHQGDRHVARLDVDDRDWGGPETITLTNPPPGSYDYWVHDYGGGPGDLGSSQVVVRAFDGDALVGEYRPPATAVRTWRPFRELAVGPDRVARIVPFTAAELAAGAATREDPRTSGSEPAAEPPPEPAPAAPPATDDRWKWGCAAVVFVVVGLWIVLASRRQHRRGRD